MPPKKKGKKPAGNPARGFATVSVASKPKAALPVDIDTSSNTHSRDLKLSNGGAADDSTVQTPQVKAGDAESASLTPEQLEAQLRDDELQILVERHADQVKRASLRNANRLKTDRRILRNQSEAINTRPWIPEDLQSQILQLIGRENQEALDEAEGNVALAPSSLSDDLLTRIWQLKRTLTDLDFCPEDVEEAIKVLLTSSTEWHDENTRRPPSNTWGLDSCLRWLGFNCPLERLPDYHTAENFTLVQRREEKERQKSTVLEDITVTSDKHEAQPSVLESTSDVEEPSSSSEEEEFDADDPDHLIKRYLRLMKRLHKIKPDLTDVVRDAKKNRKKQAPLRVSGSEVPKVQQILDQIKLLESDMLFDKDSAQTLWANYRYDLEINTISIRKTKTKTEVSADPANNVLQEDEDPRDRADAENVGDFVGLGDFMESLPEVTQPGLPASSTETSDPPSAVQLRDFGKWSGTQPRRVLEDACRSRDAGVKLTFRPTGHSYHARYSLEVRWSSPQDLQIQCPVEEVTLQTSQSYTRFDMEGVSTPEASQSEAYVATVGLYGLFAASAKEEKTYMRLPSVWRNLYAELRDTSKRRAEIADKAELSELRDLGERSLEQVIKESGNQRFNKAPLSEERLKTPSLEARGQTSYLQDAQAVREVWQSKASTPAFAAMESSRSTLPMWNFKTELMSAIDANQVVIICGETGCGKSTQTPSFILEHELSQGRDCKIYCTEPRRISAISLAQRVSQELGENRHDLGTKRSLVGYSIRLESKITSSTRLIYATSGVVMRMLERNPDLGEITHLILDEVHERTIDSDFLLIILRRLMARRPQLKVILMSATLNADRFSQYLSGAPIFNVPGRTYPVEVRFLEDAIEATKYGSQDSRSGRSQINSEIGNEDEIDSGLADSNDTVPGQEDIVEDLSQYSVATRNALREYNQYRINYELIIRLLDQIAKRPEYASYSSAVLVFLPGINEIRRMNDALLGHPTFNNGWQIFPLHSTIAIEEQERAFKIPPKGMRKIVLATNIAETGITIPDVTCVIDTGTHKEMRYDERRQLSRLIESFISRANAKQRRGRAGRVREGICFHLFTRARHDRLMADQQTPEIMRLSLQDLVLRVKICELGNIESTLSEALDAPLAKNIRRAIDHLIDVRALTSDERLTPLGRQLAKLPLDVFLGKLILLGSIYGCLDSCLSFAAILSSRSPFSAVMAAKTQADHARLSFKKGDSDLLTVFNAYSSWRRVCLSQGASETDFCRRNFLSTLTLGNIEELKAQLTSSLVEAGFLSDNETLRASLGKVRSHTRQRHFVELPTDTMANDGNETLINSVIAWSFYPKLLARDGKGWRSITSNQSVALHPSSVNKTGFGGRYLSYYSLMQSAGKAYNAHETSAVDDFAIALACGEAEFKLYAGIVAIDSNRIRFAMPGWKSMIALSSLRSHVIEILEQKFRNPGRALSDRQQQWLQLWQRCFEDGKSA